MVKGPASSGTPTATSQNAVLTKGYLDDGGSGAPDITVKSPYLLNDIYVMPGTDQTTAPITISALSINGTFYKGNGAGATVLASGINDSWVTTEAWTAADTLVESTNFIKVLGQSGVSIKGFTASPGRSSIAGIQIRNGYTGTFSYWDRNGATAGSGNLGGAWNSASWSTSEDGTAATTAWTAGRAAVFSAGTDGTDSLVVTLTGTQSADAVWVQEGDITLSGGTLDLSAGIGLLRGDDFGLIVDSKITAVNLMTVGEVDLNGTNTVTGTATIGGNVFLGSNQTFPKIAGAGALSIGTSTLTVGDATNSTFGGELSGSGVLNKVGTGTLTLSSVSAAFSGSATVAAGTLDMAAAGDLGWNVGGAGNFTKSSAGQLTVVSNISTAGVLDIKGGTLQVGKLGTNGSIGTPSSILLNNSRLSYRLSGANAVLSSPVTIGATGGFIRQNPGLDGDLLTITSTVGADTTVGTLEILSGDMVLGSGANVKVFNASLTGPTAGDRGTLVVQAGATLAAKRIYIGNGAGQSGIVNQTGGTVTMAVSTEGDDGIRIGHWDNGSDAVGSEYNISAGTLDASNSRLSVGWDGKGTLDISGTGIVKARLLAVDPANLFHPGIVNLHNGGRLEVGTDGITYGATPGSVLNLAGGTLAGVGTSTWNALLDANAATSSTIEVGSGFTVTQNRLINGSGALAKTGAGTLVISAAEGSYSGALTVSGGTLKINGEPIPNASAITIGSAGAIGTGTTGTPGPGTVSTLSLAAGSSSSFRLGATSDQLIVYDTNGLTTAGSHSISVQPVGALAVGSIFPVIDYDGAIQGAGYGAFSLAPFPNPHYSLSLSNNTIDTTIDVKVTAVTPVTWAGPGSWNLVNSNWTAGGPTSKFYAFDIATFNDLGAAVSVVVDTNGGLAPITPAAMIFNNTIASTYTVSGDPISGTGGLTKTGDGTVILTNNNTFTGAINIQAGTLQIGSGGTTGSLSGGGAITVTTPGKIVFNRSDASTLSRRVIGGGDLVLTSGNLTMSAANNDANIIVNSGTLFARGGGFSTAFNAGKLITVNAGGVLDTVAHSMGSAIGGGGDVPMVTLNGGTWNLNNEQYMGTLTMTAGSTTGAGQVRTLAGGVFTTNAAAVSSTMAARVIIYGNVTFQVADGAAAADLLISGPIGGGASLNKTGPGRLVSSGANDTTGNININGGEVVFTGDNTARTGGTAINGTTFTTSSFSAAAMGTGFISLSGGTLNYTGTGSETTTRFLWIDQGSGTFNITNAAGYLTMNPAGGVVNKAVIKDGPGRLRLQGVIAGGGSVTVNGGRLTLDGANTYTGDTTVNAGGTIDLDSPKLNDTSTVRINSTGKLNLDFVATDLIGALVIDGTPKTAAGTYGALGSGADFPSSHFAGSGLVKLVGSGTPYTTWLTLYTFPGGADTTPTGDPDNDGMTNQAEFAFGTNPTSGSSVSPITQQLNKATGIFKYTRYASSGLTYKIETSTSLTSWAVDTAATASQVAGAVDGLGNQEVTVTIPGPYPLSATKFFVRVSAK